MKPEFIPKDGRIGPDFRTGIGFFGIAVFLVSVFETGAAETVHVEKLEPGPWGEIEFYELVIEPPDWVVRLSKDYQGYQRKIVWKFSAVSPDEVSEIFRDAGLDRETIGILVGPDCYRAGEGGGVEIRPPEAVIEALSPEQRERLYPRIEPRDFSSLFFNPYHLERRGFALMAANSGISPRSVDLVSRLTWLSRGRPMLSDIGLVMKRAADDEERWRLMKTLRRVNSLALRLKISESSSLAGLADYWSARGRNKDSIPILESVAGTPGVERLDLLHLLPPTPRKLIHSYPGPSDRVGKVRFDCFWTALNFFAYEPSNRPIDDPAPRRILVDRYERAPKPWGVGDLIVISDVETGNWIHACNYIAGDIVFTKNGRGLSSPWVFQRLDDVLRNYLWTEEITATFYRLKPEFRH